VTIKWDSAATEEKGKYGERTAIYTGFEDFHHRSWEFFIIFLFLPVFSASVALA